MSLLSGFLRIFAGSDTAVTAVGKAVEKVAEGADHLWYSDEEKAGDGLKRGQMSLEWGKLVVEKTAQAMNESAAQTLSRRYMAWFIVFNAGAISWLYILAYMLGSTYAMMNRLAIACQNVLNYWEYALTSVVIFYFVAHSIRAYQRRNGGRQ